MSEVRDSGHRPDSEKDTFPTWTTPDLACAECLSRMDRITVTPGNGATKEQ